MSPGFLALIIESQRVQVLLFGTVDCLNPGLKDDQNFLVLVRSSSGRDWKNSLRLDDIKYLDCCRSSRNFSHAVALDFAVAFFLAVFFFFKRSLTSLSIQAGLLRFLTFLDGIWSVAAPSNRSFQRCQSASASASDMSDGKRSTRVRASVRPSQSAKR